MRTLGRVGLMQLKQVSTKEIKRGICFMGLSNFVDRTLLSDYCVTDSDLWGRAPSPVLGMVDDRRLQAND
jgi:hypothetical protein